MVGRRSFEFDPELYPPGAGVYLFKDAQGKIIYVGKAKNLRRRLTSYFGQESVLSVKTRILVNHINQIDFLCTSSEKEALLLEASLIKKHRPKYNIVLKDDKAYLLFKLDRTEPYPRLTITRKVHRDRARYFGPFTSAHAARTTLRVLNRLFPLRKCKDQIFRNRVRPCLQHQLGRCLAPCVLPVSRERYADLVRQVELFLQGRVGRLLKDLEKEMLLYAEQLEFEQAARLRDQIAAVRKTVEEQNVIFADGREMDVINFCALDAGLGLAVLFVRQGKLLGLKQFFWPDQVWRDLIRQAGQQGGVERAAINQDLQEVLSSFLLQFYGPGRYIPGKIILPVPVEDRLCIDILRERRGAEVKVKPARSRAEKQLLGLAEENVKLRPLTARQDTGLPDLANVLHLKKVPRRIEAVDASHFYGQGMLVGQVVWEDGEFLPSAYRIYSFPELEDRPDDYLALSSWAKRRLNSGQPLPDLVVVDGGAGQLSAVVRGLKSVTKGVGHLLPWAMVGLAKTSRRQGELADKVYLPYRKNPLPLSAGSPALLFLQHLRDQAHDFVLTKMRQGQQRKLTEQSLEGVLLRLPGVGPRLAQVLAGRYKTMDQLVQATVFELEELPGIGRSKAQGIMRALNNLR